MKLKMIVLYWSLSRANMHSKKQLHCIFVYGNQEHNTRTSYFTKRS